ncbi:DUF6970 domain-containing protein [Reichenbachiella ulvae]|uniref:DUF6970 domain-containing protein n=1 Tax=Reichenbachiella ulvae TaxID=2980104 RepID=A0ABT3CZG1_9BACT|nr:hypothetical protein [Reichenbachiella ulvae]MCV9388964.1 hypothetical protein [Reichenbachiella ulvae]
MKNLFSLLLFPLLIIACEGEELESSYLSQIHGSDVVQIKYGGDPAADGVGWYVEVAEDTSVLVTDLPEVLQAPGTFLFPPYSSFVPSGKSIGLMIGGTVEQLKMTEGLPEQYSLMYYQVLQCANPWELGGQSEKEIIDALRSEKGLKVPIIALKIHEVISDQGYCEACTCGNGKYLMVLVEDQYIDELEAFGFVGFGACSYLNPIQQLHWLERMIFGFEQDQEVSKVLQWEYEGDCVFQVDHCYQCPDAMSVVYNADQEVICEFGGIAGVDTCPDFHEKAMKPIELYFK